MRSIIVFLFLMLLTSGPGFAGVARFPCEDINDNGVCDAGDKDISAAPTLSELVHTIPRGRTASSFPRASDPWSLAIRWAESGENGTSLPERTSP